jgi:hypothetical protein
MTMPRIPSTNAVTGTAHPSVTTALNRRENLDTWLLETTVTPRWLPWVRIGLIGLNSVTPRWSAWSMMLFRMGVTLTTTWPPLPRLLVSDVCLPVRTSTPESCVCRFSVSHNWPNCWLSSTLTARPYT